MLVIQHFRHCSEQKLARKGEVKEREQMCLFITIIIILFYSDESLSPCRWKTDPQHEAATSTLYF